MEDYAAKMLLKTDAALREYVTGHAQYREAAVLAALDELRRRGQTAPEEASLRPGLEAGAAEQAAREAALEAERQRAAPPVEATDEPSGPVLYSQTAIVLFSLLFTMIMGGILLSINLYRLGRKGAMLGLLLFILAYLVAGSLLMGPLLTALGISPVLGGLLFNIPAALLYALWVWPRYVGPISYRSRSILLPMLIYFVFAWGALKLITFLPQKERQKLEKMMQK
ncbi:hypothetical protein [Hymenobacter properus]|uniref:Uncharacterized protein n=1 Tax=Hymenobacter properus TaxID=2791026 RepID=A0A931BIE6_9BACT|nr:hypothetical protein [Hymenobacter properus]MBF9143076.1 hypothetical protein [Hymenobacter properus]MBR7721884.1 hypothetical protein [Microvirga sp. SRT04]